MRILPDHNGAEGYFKKSELPSCIKNPIAGTFPTITIVISRFNTFEWEILTVFKCSFVSGLASSHWKRRFPLFIGGKGIVIDEKPRT